MNACGGLLIVLLVVALLAGVIHGFWVIIRLISGTMAAAAPPPVVKPCRECGSKRLRPDGHCADCGASRAANVEFDSDAAVWESAKRELRRLHNRGLLSRNRLQEVIQALDVERSQALKLDRSPAGAVFPEEPAVELLGDIVLPGEQRDEAVKTPVEPLHFPQVTRSTTEEPLEITAFAEPVELVEFEEAPAVRETVPPTEPPAKRGWGKLLQAFMEEKNIRWGELLSAMLIVGSAIGLVISLWSTLKDSFPYFPALLFMLTTAAIHGAGLYTLRRWKLQSTSRGLLLISTLLIPLNFLAAIALSTTDAGMEQRPVTDPLYLAAIGIGIVCYGLIAISSGRVFRKRQWWAMWLAVMVPSIGQLIIARLAEPQLSTEMLNWLAGLPAVGYLVAMVAQLQIASHGRHFPKRRADQTFQMLAIGLFSLLMAWGLLVSKTGHLVGTLAAISPIVSIVAVLIASAGLIVHQRAERNTLATTRTIGTAVTLTGASFMLASLSFAWPRPELLVAVGLVDVFALTAMALSARLPALHLPAIAAAALTALTSLHWWQDTIQTGGDSHRMLLDALLMGRSSLLLLGLGGLCLLLSSLWKTDDRQDDRRNYLLGAGGLAGVGVLVAYYAGFVTGVDAAATTPVFACVAAGLLMTGRLLRQAWASGVGAVVLFSAFFHLFEFNPPVMAWLSDNGLLPVHSFVMSALLTATFTAGWACVVRWREREMGDESHAATNRSSLMNGVIAPLCVAALGFSAVALPRLIDVQPDVLDIHSAYLFWIAGIWGLTSITMRHRFAMTGAQVVSLVAVGFAAAAFAQTLDWWNKDFGDPRHWQIQVGTLAVWCLLLTVCRRLTAGSSFAAELLGTDEPNFDHAVLGGLVVTIAGLCMAGALPALAAEFRLLDVVREHAVNRPTPADSLAMFMIAALFVAAGFSAAFAASKPIAAPTIIAGTTVAMFVLVLFPTAASHAVAPDDPLHVAQFGPSLWIVLGLVAAGLLATFWERVSTIAILGVILLGAMVPLQIAAQFAATPTAATVLRWGLAAYAVIAFVAFQQRKRIVAVMAGLGCRGGDTTTELRRETAASGAIVVTVFPLLGLTALAAGLLFNGATLPIATSDAWIALRNVGWSNAAPLWVLAAVCLGLAFVERKPAFAMAASLFIQLGVSLLFVLPLWEAGTGLGGLAFAELIQWNAIGLGVCTLLWMAAVGQAFQPDPTDEHDPVSLERLTYTPFGAQLLLTTIVTVGLSVWAAVAIIAAPDRLAPVAEQLGDWKSFAAFALAVTAIVLSLRRVSVGLTTDGIAVSLLMFVPLLAAAAGRLDFTDTWRTYHVLTAGWTAALLALTVFGCLGRTVQNPGISENPWVLTTTRRLNWSLAFATVIVFLGVRAQWDDPQRPWWLVGTAATAAACIAVFGILRRSQGFAYLSTGLVLLATTAALSQPWIGLAEPPTELTYQTVIWWNVVALAAAGFVWLLVDGFHQRRNSELLDLQPGVMPVHHTAARIGLVLTGLFAIVLVFLRTDWDGELAGKLLPMASPLGWGMVLATAVLSFASLWDRRATHAIPGLFVMGLVASLTAVDAFDFHLRQVWLCIGGIAAGYGLLTGLLWWQGGRLSQLAGGLFIPEEQRRQTLTGDWLPVVQIGLAALATVIHFWVVLKFDDDRLRLAAGIATALFVPAFACFAQKSEPRDFRKSLGSGSFRFLALSAAVVASLQVVWSFSTTDLTDAVWLERTIRLLEVSSVATLLYALGSLKLLKPDGPWGSSLRHVAVTTGGLALATLLLVLGMEGALRSQGDVPITDSQVLVVSVILVGLAAGLIVLAVLPGRDPLRLSERGRMVYVYAAEVVGSLLFLHIFLTKREWFQGFLLPYWEFIVLGIAFAGAGLGEWFQRRKLRVLAEPLQWTGAFLPLLPALAFWMMAPETFDKYSGILFLAGLLYVLLAMWRQSFGYAIAAAVVGNLALWSLFYHYGLMFLTRPQVWLIPPALSVLVAGHLNRKRLSDAQLTALRYVCITLIYVSSTGEMFIAGAGRSWLHPMILATLAIAGVLTGMMLRIRAFLYLGSSFLLLSMVSMVWHAARAIDQVWPWWVFGLVMGILLLVFFGIFEKKRNEVLRVFGRLKEWER